MCTAFVSHNSDSKCITTKLLPKELQCFCWLILMTAFSWSCWQEWHNYCHSWNIDCDITDWLIYLLRLRRAPLLCLAHLDTRMQHISVYEVTWAKHAMALLTWIHSVFITLFLSCCTICYFCNSYCFTSLDSFLSQPFSFQSAQGGRDTK